MGKQIGYKWKFIGSLLVVSLIAIISYACLARSFHQRLNRIEEIQMADCKQMNQLFDPSIHNNRVAVLDAERFSNVLAKHEEKMESLMEMEFGKLQNDFNFISLWAGILTIVFLIFSIYSIFKTDEMLKQAEKVYEHIKRKETSIEKITNNIQKKYQGELEELKKESDNYSNEMAQKMTLLNERLANADIMIRKYKEAAQTDEVVQASTDEQDVQDNNEEA